MSSTLTRPSRWLAFGLALVPTLALRPVDEWNGLRGSLAKVGDIDGDGAADFALARRPITPVGFPPPSDPLDLGAVWVFSGCNGELLRTLHAPEPCVDFGRTLENVGDIDGDGITDLAVAGCGHVWIFSGTDGAVLREFGGQFATPGFGVSVAGGLDITGDSTPDIVVFRRNMESKRGGCEYGYAFVYSGRSGQLLRIIGCGERAKTSLPIPEELYTRVEGDGLLAALSIVPDRDGDTLADLAVTFGQRGTDPHRDEQGVELLASSSWRSLLRFPVPSPEYMYGPWVLRALEDVDGDGTAELLVSIVHQCVACYSGLTGVELHQQSFEGVAMNGEGTTLDVVEDIDADGFADYVMGANEEAADNCDPGLVSLYSGRTGELRQCIDYMYTDSIDELGDCGIGVDACAIGDANGDQICDIAVHMPRIREARVLSGKNFSVVTTVDLPDLEPVERR